MSPQLRRSRGAPSHWVIKGGKTSSTSRHPALPLGKPNHSATGKLIAGRFLIILSWKITLEGVMPTGDKLCPYPHRQA